MKARGFQPRVAIMDMGYDHETIYAECEQRGCHPVIPLRETPAVKAGKHKRPVCEHGEWTFAGADAKRRAAKWHCPTAECSPASRWIGASRLHTLIPRGTARWKKLYRQRGSATAFQGLLADHGEQLRQRYGLHLADSWPDDPATVGWRSAHFGSPKLGHVFGEKIPPAFVEQLIELDLAVQGGRRDPYWIGMHPKLATLYMLVLADAMARRRGAHPVTDDTLNHLAVGGFNMERLAEALLDDVMEPQPPSDQEVEQLEAGLVLQVAVPADLDHVPVDKLLEFREKHAAERAALVRRLRRDRRNGRRGDSGRPGYLARVAHPIAGPPSRRCRIAGRRLPISPCDRPAASRRRKPHPPPQPSLPPRTLGSRDPSTH